MHYLLHCRKNNLGNILYKYGSLYWTSLQLTHAMGHLLLLKVSRSQNKIVKPQKTNGWIYFLSFSRYSSFKYVQIVRIESQISPFFVFFGEVKAQQFVSRSIEVRWVYICPHIFWWTKVIQNQRIVIYRIHISCPTTPLISEKLFPSMAHNSIFRWLHP